MKRCHTCRRELTAKERRERVARCDDCREKLPGHVLPPKSGDTWRRHPAIFQKPAKDADKPSRSWWVDAPRETWNATVQSQGESPRMKKAGRGRVSVPGHVG